MPKSRRKRGAVARYDPLAARDAPEHRYGTRAATRTTILSLPPEVLERIFSFVPRVFQARLACRLFCATARPQMVARHVEVAQALYKAEHAMLAEAISAPLAERDTPLGSEYANPELVKYKDTIQYALALPAERHREFHAILDRCGITVDFKVSVPSGAMVFGNVCRYTPPYQWPGSTALYPVTIIRNRVAPVCIWKPLTTPASVFYPSTSIPPPLDFSDPVVVTPLGHLSIRDCDTIRFLCLMTEIVTRHRRLAFVGDIFTAPFSDCPRETRFRLTRAAAPDIEPHY